MSGRRFVTTSRSALSQHSGVLDVVTYVHVL